MSPANKRAHIALTVIGLSGIALSFVPFTSGITPLTDVMVGWDFFDGLWQLVGPCVILPVPISMGYAIWLITGRQSRLMVNTSYVFAALGAGSVMTGMNLTGPYAAELVATIVIFAAAFISGAWLSTRRIERDLKLRGLIAMQCVYTVVAFAYFSRNGFRSGAWLGVVTMLAYVGQIALAVKKRCSVLAVIVPMVGIVCLIGLTQDFW